MIGFRGGAVMGLLVVGCSLLGVAAVLMATGNSSILLGFSFGASSLALFAKAGGGIFTKTADVSADLTGKVELGIPEDDPRNPAVIADNVGDNVGDVAGMGADLFDSNVAAMASALVIAQSLSGTGFSNISMVFCYAILGLLASVIGIAASGIGKKDNPTKALNSSTYVTTGIFLVLTALATLVFEGFSWRIWGASAVGLLVGVIIGITTDYFTDDSKPIVRKVAHASAPARRSRCFPALHTDLSLPCLPWWALPFLPSWPISSVRQWATAMQFSASPWRQSVCFPSWA